MYRKCLEKIRYSVKGKSLVEKMQIVCRILKNNILYYLWTVLYFLKKDVLELRPFYGPPACAHIPFTGVRGKVSRTNFPETSSAIALPIFDEAGQVIAFLEYKQ
jgi:putative methionine-R-sulfoxide reductase with GAF domain